MAYNNAQDSSWVSFIHQPSSPKMQLNVIGSPHTRLYN